MHNHKINWKNAILAGVIGTFVFDLVGFLFTGQWWDIPTLLGAKTGLGLAYGVIGHFSNGILLAILYAGIAPSLWGPAWARTLLFVTAETVALVWLFMFPLLGAGIAGTKMGEMVPFISLLRHIAYGVPLYLLIHKYNAKNIV
ncbi:hypothetical protein LB467_13215 [Salegentibacter sp. JZCK2]|uniref:hypothetical protein n=1 Tax=Salegentibacter tibetensis TaxID=2873600 RepID=UPI001CCB56A1|nr:hypothetical protein [Salegentibacter tibetensis]MBZ9730649.1 hypothetical protein [Salegentibacter tibetensis]